MNYKVTVLGQVGHEGAVPVPGEKITILEAIGLAGGINDYGLKNTVKVIREADGKREIGMIDLSSKNLFESPYYNLVQNDVLIIEPSKQKAKQVEEKSYQKQQAAIKKSQSVSKTPKNQTSQ